MRTFAPLAFALVLSGCVLNGNKYQRPRDLECLRVAQEAFEDAAREPGCRAIEEQPGRPFGDEWIDSLSHGPLMSYGCDRRMTSTERQSGFLSVSPVAPSFARAMRVMVHSTRCLSTLPSASS